MARKRLGSVPRPVLQEEPALARLSAQAPIAQVAGGSSAAAALEEVSAELTAAREEGRLIQKIAVKDIHTSWLIRDRLRLDPEELEVLKTSIKAHGQRTPIEVVAKDGDGLPYGLISGLRRVIALGDLHRETGDPQYAMVNALVRKPETAQDAYVAMIEENEIRAGLSFYERARLAADAVRINIFADEKHALQTLFASVSRAKRSKIGSFVDLVHLLEGKLMYGERLSERMGLQLVAALRADPAKAAWMTEQLQELSAREDPAAEMALIEQVIAKAAPVKKASKSKAVSHATLMQADVGSVTLTLKGKTGDQMLELKGKGVDAVLFEVLAKGLAQYQGC